MCGAQLLALQGLWGGKFVTLGGRDSGSVGVGAVADCSQNSRCLQCIQQAGLLWLPSGTAPIPTLPPSLSPRVSIFPPHNLWRARSCAPQAIPSASHAYPPSQPPSRAQQQPQYIEAINVKVFAWFDAATGTPLRNAVLVDADICHRIRFSIGLERRTKWVCGDSCVDVESFQLLSHFAKQPLFDTSTFTTC